MSGALDCRRCDPARTNRNAPCSCLVDCGAERCTGEPVVTKKRET